MKLGKQNKAVVLEMIENDEFIKILTMREDMLVKMTLALATGQETEINTMFELIGLGVQAFMLDGAVTKGDNKYQICLITKDKRMVLMSVMTDDVHILSPSPITLGQPRRLD